jgi:hypothetical protein
MGTSTSSRKLASAGWRVERARETTANMASNLKYGQDRSQRRLYSDFNAMAQMM